MQWKDILLKKTSQSNEASKEIQFRKVFTKYIPETAVDYVMELWQDYPFTFKVAASRKTCLGNYIYRNGIHYISVNGDSNPYSFLITLIHEIAHQRVQLTTKHRTAPHGAAWKLCFINLMKPLLNPTVFPDDILGILALHMQNPAASSTKDPQLMLALEGYSPEKKQEGIFLKEVLNGNIFKFRGRPFVKIQDRRTRTLVECTTTKKRYTIPATARIDT